LDLLDGVFSTVWQVSQFHFGLITAYCLLAYYIGVKLTFFQVTFVNVCFFLMSSVGALATFNGFKRIHYLLDLLPDTAVEALPLATTPVPALMVFSIFLLTG
jgi:hypothetical protein